MEVEKHREGETERKTYSNIQRGRKSKGDLSGEKTET